MTMQELELRTPNGLHDAYLLGQSVDYRTRTLRFEINWLVGLPDGKTDEEREGYRLGTLIIYGLAYHVIEAPAYPNPMGEPSYIDGFVTRPSDIERCQLPEVRADVFRHSIFVGEWNSFIHFAGTAAEVIPADLIVRSNACP